MVGWWGTQYAKNKGNKKQINSNEITHLGTGKVFDFELYTCK